MYCDFYHLSEKPFNITPDPKFLYLNARYREALATLNYGITERKGFITLIGEAGTGKTTLLNKLLDQLDEKTKTVFIFNTNVTFEEILEYIFAEFDLPVHSGKKLYMLQRLNAFLLEELRGGGNVAVLIDEAQDLDIGVLENLRLLSNLETAKEKILQIVLSGQPELEQKLASPELRQLRQRIAVSCRLSPLTRDELSEYLEFRLAAAGCADPKMFARDAEEQVWHFSQGIPRLVNVVCDNALVIGYALGKKRIGADIVREASADLLATLPSAPAVEPDRGAATGEPVPAPARGGRGTWALFALVAVALAVGFLSMGRNLWRQTAVVAESPSARERTILHPGEVADELPPAQVGADPSNGGGLPEPQSRVAEVVAPGVALADRVGRDTAETSIVAREAPDAVDADADAQLPSAQLRVAEALAAARLPAPPVAPQPAAPAVIAAPEAALAAPEEHRSEEIARAAPVVPSAPAADLPEEVREEPPAEPAPAGGVRLSGTEYDQIRVREGDSFAQIAVRKYGQSSYTILDLLKLANPEVKDINRIAAGQTLALPRLGPGFSVVRQEGRGFGVLVYSSPSGARATSLSSALRARGFPVDLNYGSVGPGRTVQRVIVGPFGSEAEAVEASRDVQRAFREDDKLATLGRS
jgi:general secretion pathway protein A